MELGWVKNIDKLEEALSLESFLFKKDGHVELQKCLRTATKRRKKKAIIIWLSFVSCRIQWGYEVIERPCAMAT